MKLTQTDLAQICGRLSAHEFLLEIVMANDLAFVDDAICESFFDDIRRKGKQGYIQPEAPVEDSDFALRVGAEGSAVLARLVEKIRSRRNSIRKLADNKLGS